jgi:hypothetical protein
MKRATITCTVTWKEVKEGRGTEARKHRTDSSAKCSIAERWFQVNANFLLNVFAYKESSTHEYCIIIHELSYTNPCLSSPSENKVTSQCKEQV